MLRLCYNYLLFVFKQIDQKIASRLVLKGSIHNVSHVHRNRGSTVAHHGVAAASNILTSRRSLGEFKDILRVSYTEYKLKYYIHLILLHRVRSSICIHVNRNTIWPITFPPDPY